MKWIVIVVLLIVLFLAPLIGLFSQPLAPWWFGQQPTGAQCTYSPSCGPGHTDGSVAFL